MNGVIVIKKESGYTSRDVINILNKKCNTKRIGHTGTLDPLATGVLVVCIGKYTKLVDKITSYEKEYIAKIKLGIETDTLDITGEVIKKNKEIKVDNQTLRNTLSSFLGKSMQEVPKYAAIKINGKKLYEYARKKEEVFLPKREIEVKEIELLENKEGEITFRAVVTKGTYIRSLIRDICAKLGILGTMSGLTRTRQGNFTIEQAFTLQQIEKKEYKLLTLEELFSFRTHFLKEEEIKKVKNGARIELQETDAFLFMKYKQEILAIYQKKEDGYHPYFMV